VLSGIGTGLAVIALTLPWVSVSVTGRNPLTLPVTSLPGYGPIFAILLVGTTLFATVTFSVTRRPVGTLRFVAVILSPVPALMALFAGLRPSTEVLRAALPDNTLEYWEQLTSSTPKDLPVSAMSGLTLYVAGLLMIGIGLAVATSGSSERIVLASPPSSTMPPRRKAIMRRAALAASAPLVVLSLALAWFQVTTSGGEMPAIAEGWRTVYRVGIITTLLCLTGVALTVGNIQRMLRMAGLYLCGGLIATLDINALLLWDPAGLIEQFSVELDSLRPGPAFIAAIAVVPFLMIVFWASSPVESDGAENDQAVAGTGRIDEQAGESP
jgi:hypothetical protein